MCRAARRQSTGMARNKRGGARQKQADDCRERKDLSEHFRHCARSDLVIQKGAYLRLP